MLKKLIIILITTLTLTLNVHAASDGELILKKNEPSEVKDCFESLNRATFEFNQALDGIIFKPVANVYKKLPAPVKSGVSNSLDNLSILVTVPNNIIQGDFSEAGVNSGRFLINSTLGILGLFDVAQSFGLVKQDREDYGQSLAKLGAGPGCYVVLPILGPTTARDAVASVANFTGGDAWYNVTVVNDTQHFSEADYYLSRVAEGVDFRAKNLDAFDSLENNSLDLYASVRSLYLQDRQRKINNLDETTETLSDDDWEELDSQ